MTARGVFIAGTDTGVGKTYAACALLQRLRASGLLATGMKPVASGCADAPDGLRNDDALALIAASNPRPDYVDCNPFAFAEPVSPHIAAVVSGRVVTLPPIEAAYARLAARTGVVVVEGVGGWLAPLSDTLLANAIPRTLGLPVILVVGLRLGCLNHSLLTARAIRADGCRLIGWIGNRIDPAMNAVDANIATLRAGLGTRCLGVLGYRKRADPALASAELDAVPELVGAG